MTDQSLLEALKEARQRLAQACGIVVEFGDLNGFRNLSDQELGQAVIQMAQTAAATLDRIDATLSDYEASQVTTVPSARIKALEEALREIGDRTSDVWIVDLVEAALTQQSEETDHA